MSSLRNATQRRNHRERAQPHERRKYGLLEKHKDYSLRAADYNAKKRTLASLGAKARERNEDEFYFAMVHGSSKGGVRQGVRGEGNNGEVGPGGARGVLSDGVVRLMKTQDQGYLRTALQRCRRERERLEEIVVGERVGVDGKGEALGKRVVFGKDGMRNGEEEEEEEGGEDVDDDLADLEGLDESGESDRGEETTVKNKKTLSPEQKKKSHGVAVRKRKLAALRVQEEELTIALREVEDQRARMNGTIGGVNKNGIKFKTRQRKR